MKFSKKQIVSLILAVIVAFFLSTYKLPYYIQKPGGADALKPIVQVENANESEGDFHLVTVRGGQATPIQYALAKILPHHQILDINDVRPEGITDEEYFQAQLQMMESSQEASTVVAYTAAGKDITIEFNGVYVVSVVPGLAADGILQMGDRIIGIDDLEIKESNDLISYIEKKKIGDQITVRLIRDDKEISKDITLGVIDEETKQVGIGITLVTDRDVQVNPPLAFSSGNIGGPSAGLMFSLEIYNQLTEEDLTKGHQIAGTGEIDYEGNVGRIGGIDKKVVAADREGVDVFFAPNEGGRGGDSNYEVAKKKAEEIGTDMVIVPVDTFDDALRYLKEELK
ncbi:PDZ domain-containing protein [Ornithinibacillus sp. BX22]|uniref:endopeptidase La n=2 Tax=Ornithinibacillus TaxID=484508 RepID=A0A923RIR1_9BACI|nr:MULTISPECIES: SepM family pheromone-processing serine protease [Ornithinibacillus]MBC5635857.1 PDZ domain-containing protein [Ornithinibacillus hominis]MBS3680154.1 PDZ domain-containing protein [Ornithinibacillus massiliensis]